MTDKQYTAQKKRVTAVWDKWFSAIGMGWWRIDRDWSRERDQDVPDALAMTTCNWQYRTANITFYLPAIANVDDDHLEETILHEFTHVLLAPIQDMRDDQAREITEHTVTTVARAIQWASENVNKESKK